MKLTDLAIGDLILINNTPHKIQAIDSIDAEILADDELYYVGEDRCHSEDKIEGIPITPEILEKNGWNLDTVLQCYTSTPLWLYGEGIINLLLQFPSKQSAGSLEIFDNQKIRSLFDFTWKDRLYIHELQHTLRLCGLDKLADNFKV